MKLATFQADALLLLAAVIWGTGFVAQRAGMEHVGPMAFTGIRFALGTLVLLPIIYIRRHRPTPTDPQARASARRVYLLGGTLAGLVLFIGVSLQQIGLIYTTAGKAGFITGLYVIIVPIIGFFLRYHVRSITWIGAGLAAVGLYFLSVSGSFEVNRGDGFVLACAVVWAVHVLIIGWLSPRTDPLPLAAMQFAITSALGLIAALLTEDLTAESILAAKGAILYGGVFAVGVGYTLQVVGQRDAPPAHAAILLSLEAVFAAVAGGLILTEVLTSRELLGCALMLGGVLTSQIRKSGEVWTDE
jgi:drug/metabolite transporter (DMT)-like permease